MLADEVFDSYKELSTEQKEVFDEMWKKERDPIQKEMDYLNELSYRVAISEQLRSMTDDTGTAFIPINWILKNVLKLSPEDLTNND